MKYYEIFKSCFPELKITEEQFVQLSEQESCDIFTCSNGFAFAKENQLRLICVSPENQRKGCGTALLKLVEEHILSQGFKCVEIGGSSSELFIGAVRESVPFFESHGFIFGDDIAEMSGKYGEILLTEEDIAGVEFRITDMNDSLRAAVAEVDADWVQYFSGGQYMCAFCGDIPAAFCIMDSDVECILSDGTSHMGSIGCVGTVPQFRRRGIGLEMVKRASRELFNCGNDRIFIHYTGVYNWYARLGYHTDLWLRRGIKNLT